MKLNVDVHSSAAAARAQQPRPMGDAYSEDLDRKPDVQGEHTEHTGCAGASLAGHAHARLQQLVPGQGRPGLQVCARWPLPAAGSGLPGPSC